MNQTGFKKFASIDQQNQAKNQYQHKLPETRKPERAIISNQPHSRSISSDLSENQHENARKIYLTREIWQRKSIANAN